MISLQAKHVSLSYPIYGSSALSLKKNLLRVTTGGRLYNQDQGFMVEALHDINLSLKSGDRLALIGHNGAGKSTFLRVLAGIYEPSHGQIIADGRISSLFDLSLGMDMESTGYENIYIRGLILGLTKKDIKKTIPEIEAFTEIGDFLSMPIKTYSSGMLVRLALGIVTTISPEILLMDEVVNAVDSAFIAKANARMHALIHRSDILVMTTHDHQMALKFCNQALWLEHGKIQMLGPTQEVIAHYLSQASANGNVVAQSK